MRTLRLALVVSRVTLEQSKIFAWTRVVAIVVATTTMVLGASFVAVALSLVGALMILYGGGQWGRWAYLWVFVSVPMVVSSLALLSKAYPAMDFTFDKPLALVLFASPMVVSYLLVQRYYRRQDARRAGPMHNQFQNPESVK